MKRIILAVAVALSLAGCAAFDNIKSVFTAAANFNVTQAQLDTVRDLYDGGALAALKSYAGFPTCATGTAFSLTNRCHDKVLLKKMRNADKAVAAAFDATQDQITSGNSSGAVAAYKTLQIAIGAIKQILSDNNIPIPGI